MRNLWTALSVCLLLGGACAPADPVLPPGRGMLRVRVLEEGTPVPARIVITAPDGAPLVPDNALRLWGDCSERPVPLTEAEILAEEIDRRTGYFGERTFSYTPGSAEMVVLPGVYALEARRGLETRVAAANVAVAAGAVSTVELELERWVDLAAEGWTSGDVHLHVPRLDVARDERLFEWLAAEDLRVAHLLEFGNARTFGLAPQFAYGEEGVAAGLGRMIVPGHENPRVSFLGHLLLLGLGERIHHPDDYFDLRRFARQAHAAGGAVAIAHQANYGGEGGAALLLPYDLLDGLEVMTRTARYGLWYDALNAGFDVAPLAGTDFPCGTGAIMPGEQRTYARARAGAAGEWIDAVRSGAVFVTNGPVLDIQVDGVGPGETVELARPGEVTVAARLRFDPAQHGVETLELVVGGRVFETWRPDATSEVVVATSVQVDRPTWIALRAGGTRTDSPRGLESFAHTGLVRVEIAGRARARGRLDTWIERLDRLEASLTDANWRALATTALDGVPGDYLEAHRDDVLAAITEARAAYDTIRTSNRR